MKTKCMDLDMLICYFEGSLSKKEESEIIEHILQCPACLETFSSANHIMGNPELDKWEPLSKKAARQIIKRMIPESKPEPRKSFFEKIFSVARTNPNHSPPYKKSASIQHEHRRGLRVFFEKISQSFLQPKFATVRSESVCEEDCMIRKTNILQTEIYLEESEPDNATIKIMVIEDNKIAKNIILTLIERKEGKIFAQHMISDFVRFEAIPLGDYQLILEQDGNEKDKLFFKIGDQELFELQAENEE
jgi:hypothetical protein